MILRMPLAGQPEALYREGEDDCRSTVIDCCEGIPNRLQVMSTEVTYRPEQFLIAQIAQQGPDNLGVRAGAGEPSA